MSKLKLNKPIEHIPSFTQYKITGSVLRPKIEALGLRIPLGLLDWQYYHTDMAGWGKVLRDLVFNSNLYKKDSFDCENYALKAMNECARKYGLNTLALVIGDIPQGRHGFNLFYHGDGFMLWEPNDGFPFSGSAFEIGEYGYQPELVVV